MNKRALLSIFLIILLALASTWFSRERTPPMLAPSTAPAHFANYFIKDFKAVTMDEYGQPKDQLRAETLTHYSDDDSSELTMPKLKVYRPGQPTWLARSERGLASGQTRELHLFDHVLIEQPGDNGAKGTQMTTDTLLINPDTHYAETAAPVTITDANSTVKAIGMHAFLAEERIELLSAVRGVYVPQ